MTVAVNDLVDKVELILQDTTNTRWGATELIGWLNDAQRVIVGLKPDANVTTAAVQLSSGTKQSLPTGGLILIDITRNMGDDGSTPGNVIRFIERKMLDAAIPDWHLTTYASGEVDHYIFDERNPTVYYVYPASDGTNYVEIAYSATPSIVAAGANIGLADIYESIIIDYILYRAYSKDADYNVNADRAQAHFSAFFQALDAAEKTEAIASPTVS